MLKIARVMAFSWSNATYVLFLLEKGIDLPTANIINICFMATVLVIDPLTGRLADKIGQRVIFVAGMIVGSIGMFAYALSTSFWGFVLAEFIVGIGYALMSEAPESWLRNRVGKNQAHSIQSTVGAWTSLLTTIPAFIGALVGNHIGYEYPWALGGFVGLLATVFLIVNVFGDAKVDPVHDENQMSIWKSISSSFAHKHIRFVFLVVIVTRICYQPFNMFWSKILEDLMGDASFIGYFWVLISIAMAIGSRMAKEIKVFSRVKLVIFMILIGVCIIIPSLKGEVIWIIVGFFMHEVFRELLVRTIWTYANDFISDSNRSTMNSIRSSVSTGANIVGLALSGVMVEFFSPLQVWILSGLLLVLFALILAVDCRKR
ncbi:MFS transporter [Candidatus Dojkabacteria bacterium]|uniref:MFS transporter n=1 Tax=Candidatus Dojkabacteria bacterium TaxID=2099670 RepID=A0A955L5T6_9BACT|nr:MFS transporter [Candidatus Dojkabacteria bacterium]